MNLHDLLPWVLVAQGAMGGFDTIVNHEIIERLPHRESARREIGWHSVREATYATLFAGLGWFEWHGNAAFFIAGLLALEIVVTSTDEWIENRTRVLPQNERVLHVFLTLNLGLILALLAPILFAWSQLPTALVRADHRLAAWILAAFAAAAACWSVRDLLAWRRLSHAAA